MCDISETGKSCPTEILDAIVSVNAEGRPIWKPMHMQPIYRLNAFITKNGDGRAQTNAYIAGGMDDVGADIFDRGLCLPSDNKMTADEQKIVIAAESSDALRPCTTTIEVDEHERTRTGSDMLFQQILINLQRVFVRFHQHWAQSVLRDGKDGGNERVGRHQHFVARLHLAHLDICTIDQRKRIEAVADSDAMTGAYKRRISRLERPCLLTLQKPARVDHLPHCLMIFLSVAGRHLL